MPVTVSPLVLRFLFQFQYHDRARRIPRVKYDAIAFGAVDRAAILFDARIRLCLTMQTYADLFKE
jgi:hypothetical protein